MKLFAVYVGGEIAGANIEVHDMRFVVAPSIEETHDELRRQWWGRPGSLHIDCWAEIDYADGYDVMLRVEPYHGPERLFYVNLGGYDRTDFAEKHRNMFVVADTVARAKARAIDRRTRSAHSIEREDDKHGQGDQESSGKTGSESGKAEKGDDRGPDEDQGSGQAEEGEESRAEVGV